MRKIFKNVLPFVVILFVLSILIVPITASADSGDGANNLYLPVVFHDFDSSWQWQSSEIVSLPEFPFSDPVIAIDLANRPHILWDVWPSDNQFIYHIYEANAGWTSPQTIDNTLGASNLILPPMVGVDGQIHLVWYNELNFGGPYRLMASSFDGNKWTGASELVRYTYNSANAAINVNIDGELNVVYGVPGIISTSYFYTQKSASGWTTAQSIDPKLSYPYSLTKVMPDQAGGVKLLIRNWNDTTLYYSYWKDNRILQQLIPLGTISTSSNSILDSEGNWHFYRTGSVPIPGGNVTGIYHQCATSTLESGAEEVLTGDVNVSDYSVTRDNNGKTVISWTNQTSGNKVLNLEIFQGCEFLKHIEYPLPSLEQPYTWGSLVATAKTAGHPGKFCALYQKSIADDYGLFCALVND